MALYTGKGDTGTTSLLCGKMTKSDARAFAIGSLDTLHAEVIGTTMVAGLDLVVKISNKIMNANSFLASNGTKDEFNLSADDVKELESMIDRFKPKNVVRKFVVAVKPFDLGFYHLNRCRTATREAERMVNRLEDCGDLTQIMAWMNRLSSVYYTLMLHRAESENLEIIYREVNNLQGGR